MVVRTIDHAKKLFANWVARDIKWVAKDTETKPKLAFPDEASTLIRGRMDVIIFSMCYRGEKYCFPTTRIANTYPTLSEWMEVCNKHLYQRLPKLTVVYQNANYDIEPLREAGMCVTRFWDTLISGWIANQNEEKSLKVRAPYYGRYLRDTRSVNFDDLRELADYAEDDVLVTDEIYQMHRYGYVIRDTHVNYILPSGKVLKSKVIDVPTGKIVVEEETLSPFHRLFLECQEFPVLRATMRAEKRGMLVDKQRLAKVSKQCEVDIERHKKEVYRLAGRKFALGSNKQKTEILMEAGVPLTRTTKKGAISVKADYLIPFINYPIVNALLEHSKVEKLYSNYLGPKGFKYFIRPSTQSIHPTLNTVGAVTGRFSCVAGDTLLQTNRGLFRFDEYLPRAGDKVLTHKFRWRDVVRKIYKGTAPMFRVELSSGESLVCTDQHRVLCGTVWKELAKMPIGATVSSYEYFSQSTSQCASGPHDNSHVSVRGTPFNKADSRTLSRNVSHSSGCLTQKSPEGCLCEGTTATLLSEQTGRQEPYEGEEWFPAPQLHRGHIGRARVSAEEDRREVCSGPSDPFLGGFRGETSPEGIFGASLGWKQDEQQALKLGVSPQLSASAVSRQAVKIAKITPLPPSGVWDIEVAEDHSYLAQGFINHNSSAPNLQTVPARKDRYKIKSVFTAPKGESIICLDFSQIELRVMALMSQDPVMVKELNDPKGDIHSATARNLDVPRDPVAKQCNFLLIFGGGGYALRERLLVEGHYMEIEEADQIVVNFDNTYRRVSAFREEMFAYHREKGYIPLLTGRRRIIQNIGSNNRYERHKAETQLANNVVQGSAQDLLKCSIVRCDYRLLNYDKILPKKLEIGSEHRHYLDIYAKEIEDHRKFFKDPACKLTWNLQVHDEVIYRAKEKRAIEAAHRIAKVMSWRPYWQPVYEFNVMIKSEGGVGPDWLSAKKPSDPALKIESPFVIWN